MIIDITNKVAYNEISANVAEFFSSNGNEIAKVGRELSRDKNGELEISSITETEKALGLNELIKAMSAEQIESYARNTSELNTLKILKHAQINAMRDSKINGGIVFENKEFQSDEKSRNLLTSTTALYFIAGATPQGFGWIATNNEVVPMDLDKLKSFSNAMGELVSINIMKANELKKAVDGAKSKAALEKIQVEF